LAQSRRKQLPTAQLTKLYTAEPKADDGGDAHDHHIAKFVIKQPYTVLSVFTDKAVTQQVDYVSKKVQTY
jgi:hypothetical protein